MVERGEVVEVVLDLGPFDHPVAEADEDVLDLTPGAVEQVQVTDRDRRRAGQGDVDRLGGERGVDLRGLELVAARRELGLERLAGGVGGRADRPPLARLELRDPAQDRSQLRLAAEVAHPQLLELGGIGRRGDRRGRVRAQALDPVQHPLGVSRPTISARARSPPPRRR